MPEFRLDAETEMKTIGADRFPLWAGPKGWQTACHNPSVIEAMLTGRPYPVRALYASGVNILVTYPDTRRTIEALRSLDFVAVAAHAMTPTAEHADLVLPKTTTLEEEEVSFMPSGPTVLFTRAVVPPQGEARCEIDIAVPLLDKMAQRQALARQSAAVALAARVQHLPAGRLRHPHRGPGADRLPPAERRAADRSSGRSRRRPAGSSCSPPPWRRPGSTRCRPTRRRAASVCPQDTAKRFPLILITGDREKSYHHSRFRDQPWAIKVSPDPRLTMHPDTARAMGLEDGAWVHLEVAGGKGPCRLRVKFSDATPPDVVNTGMGWWLPSDPSARPRRARRQHQRRARLRRPLGPRLRLLRHPRPAVPGGAHWLDGLSQAPIPIGAFASVRFCRIV